jgi:hypothetical protein
MRPDEELLGVVVHSGLVLARGDDVVAALRRITAFPAGLSLDVVVVARHIHAEAACRREREAAAHQAAEAAARRHAEAAAQQQRQAAARWEGEAAADRELLRRRAAIERRSLPAFDRSDTLRLGMVTPSGAAQWLHAYQSTSSGSEDRYRLEASFWVAPLPREGLATLVCAWPEVGLSETLTDLILPDLAAKAAETRRLWDAANGP